MAAAISVGLELKGEGRREAGGSTVVCRRVGTEPLSILS